MFTKEQLLLAKTILNDLISNPPTSGFGVCGQLNDHPFNINNFLKGNDFDGYKMVNYLAVDWPHIREEYEGKACGYFVPNNPQYRNWKGPNLELRINLMQYMLAKIDKEIGQNG